ncbi:bifunctional uroporphyrinogen-III C-methyltransferase/uroporphyrinogen-III synthase [Corynebacterium sp. 320]|uniref:uroporphyrinogen-III synthase n=1 Tax=Corynebacterium TaxID=1716 RepID=UPI00125CCB3C|nr:MULTISPECIES: uroporphyrinogen-III synthase [Corynebacterium]KAB1504419.1 bifunctional uroporphyrinogen-III C-methyltransferase/uroporphyrinogen-III synthase [Corynebacterium sp. 320]KAB1552482.1 bifunctional uroporphyrinogen-III C-methyltransferase/uroporphyrinogen-III synthase [Corynebacterium sp. 321]KAB1554303.1 bifunctional uroporphyrinogen-III C-methyltransferase/uroporphyrinogen-III synthase [Corynebacterium sp. 319]KAB3528555.1 bifunctional uroporphyrinogen-III C-methyltransferase/ur
MTVSGLTPIGNGRILFVGAGPGNPDLLTVKARDVLVNTAHAWVDPAVLTAVRKLVGSRVPVPQEKLDAAEAQWEEQVKAAKEAGARRKPPRPEPPTAAEIVIAAPGDPQDVESATWNSSAEPDPSEVPVPPKEVAAAMVACSKTGHDVIRLVAGNPLSNPYVMEELQEVANLGADFQVVPGMTGSVAVPAFTGIGVGPDVTEADVRGGADWDQLANAGLPLILTASPSDLAGIASELKSHGVAGSTPATVTLHGTTRRQRSYDVTLDTLKSIAAASGPAAKEGELPEEMLVTIGSQVGNRSKYSWWENRALYGWTVLVPRAKDQAGPMSTQLASHGAIPVEVPTISVEPPRSPLQMERAVKGLVDGHYQWIVFTSVNAVKATWEKLNEFGLDARALAGVRVAAVGPKTAQAVQDLGITPELLPSPEERNASGLVKVFPPCDPDLDLVDRVLLPRADIATDVLVDGLINLGWEVDDVVAYRTVRAAPPSPEIRDMIKTGGFDAVCFTSSSTVKNLVGIAGKPHARTIIACIGPMAAQTAKEYGLRVDVMPDVAGVPELVDALAKHVAMLRANNQLPPPRKRRRRRKKAE